jgi:hypothetical protein
LPTHYPRKKALFLVIIFFSGMLQYGFFLGINHPKWTGVLGVQGMPLPNLIPVRVIVSYKPLKKCFSLLYIFSIFFPFVFSPLGVVFMPKKNPYYNIPLKEKITKKMPKKKLPNFLSSYRTSCTWTNLFLGSCHPWQSSLRFG